jgi:hypothetical protein
MNTDELVGIMTMTADSDAVLELLALWEEGREDSIATILCAAATIATNRILEVEPKFSRDITREVFVRLVDRMIALHTTGRSAIQ